MREIKFRGYDTELEEMTYFNSDDYILQYGDILRLFIDDYDELGNPEFDYESVKDKVELMQFTGLKDKNGVEIYEGDIIDFSYDMFVGNFNTFVAKGIVVFEDGAFYVQCLDNERLTKGESYLLYTINIDTIEVIGEIYDNPELLEEE